MPVTRNRNPDRAINEEKEDLPEPDDGEDPVDGEDSYEGEERGNEEEEESYFPPAEDVEDDVSEAQDHALVPRGGESSKGKPRQTTTTARIDSLMDVMETMMEQVGSIETRISAQGGDQDGSRRLRREDEANDRDSEYDSKGGGHNPGESVPGFKRGRQPTDSS
mmetsp:Transcript_111118/g.227459  ORF Transcript_111118/g.227459 Transcript_111118/m.227459 type:complete len:164 (-) Transcript_111118:530-1021(-)